MVRTNIDIGLKKIERQNPIPKSMYARSMITNHLKHTWANKDKSGRKGNGRAPIALTRSKEQIYKIPTNLSLNQLQQSSVIWKPVHQTHIQKALQAFNGTDFAIMKHPKPLDLP